MLPTKEELKKRYSSYSDERLLEVLYNSQEYTPEALEVAKAELKLRDITNEQAKTFVTEKVQAAEEQAVKEKILSYVPLEFWEKLLFFFIWFSPFFLGSALRNNYTEDGLVLKFRQSKLFAIAGFFHVILTFIITDSLNFNETAGFLLYFGLPVLYYLIEKRIKYDVQE